MWKITNLFFNPDLFLNYVLPTLITNIFNFMSFVYERIHMLGLLVLPFV